MRRLLYGALLALLLAPTPARAQTPTRRDTVIADSLTQIAARVRAKLTPVTNARKLDSLSAALKKLPVVVPPPPPPPVVGTLLVVGMHLDSAVQANPAGATFTIGTGTHRRPSIRPKEGSTFVGQPGAVLDGENGTAFAINGHNGAVWVNNVTIKHLEIARYNPPAQRGAINMGGDGRWPDATRGWLLDSLYVHHSSNIGVRIGDRSRVLRSRVTHNAGINVGGVGNAVLVEGNEIAFGNAGCVRDPGFEGGGTKFVKTDSLIVRGNYVHDNCGPGLWTDINNRWTLYEGNRVEKNTREGIVHEVSYAAVIRNNIVTGNGTGDRWRADGWVWNAGIGIHASPDVEVYGNTLSGNYSGVVAVQQPRGPAMGDVPPEFGPFLVQNLYVHDNTVTQSSPPPAGADGAFAGGAAQDDGSGLIFTAAWNNRWRNNRYILGTNPRPFAWNNGARTPAEWRGYGHDTTGTFSP